MIAAIVFGLLPIMAGVTIKDVEKLVDSGMVNVYNSKEKLFKSVDLKTYSISKDETIISVVYKKEIVSVWNKKIYYTSLGIVNIALAIYIYFRNKKLMGNS